MSEPAPASVLIITSDFPPLVGTNTQRIQSFTRHLPKFGWIPSVVTQAIDDMELIDSRELARIPESVKILRVPNPDPFAARRRKLGIKPIDAALSATSAPNTDRPANNENTLHHPTDILKPLKTAASLLLQTILRGFVYHPDALRPWANAAAYTVLHNGFARRHQVILSSCPTYSTHIAGLIIKRATGIPWVADFRDLWLERPFRKTPSRLHNWIDHRLEAAVVDACDALVLASPAWENIFRERYGYLVQDKIFSITNGYEKHHIEQLRDRLPSRNDNKRRFVLTGAMHNAESPAPFLKALAQLRQSRPDLVHNIEIRLIGPTGEDLTLLHELAQSSGLQDQIQILGPRSNEDCIREQLKADFLLLFSALEHQDTIRGKSFEYIAVQKPILACIPPSGIQADILQQAGTALIVPYGDLNATLDALVQLLTKCKDDLKPNLQYIKKFDREILTKHLAVVLDKVSQRNTVA